MTCVSTPVMARADVAATKALPETAPLTSRQRMQQALAEGGAKFRAEQAARFRAMTSTEKEALESYWEKRTERAQRAKTARQEKRRTSRSRADNPAPDSTAMWSKAMSLEAATDSRLSMGARVALQMIRALTARGARISRAGLATLLKVHPRTVQRYLAQLRDYGYIRTRLVANIRGWVVAQMIEIAEKVLPKHCRPRVAENPADGLARCVAMAGTGGFQGETALSSSKSEDKIIILRMAESGPLTGRRITP